MCDAKNACQGDAVNHYEGSLLCYSYTSTIRSMPSQQSRVIPELACDMQCTTSVRAVHVASGFTIQIWQPSP